MIGGWLVNYRFQLLIVLVAFSVLGLLSVVLILEQFGVLVRGFLGELFYEAKLVLRCLQLEIEYYHNLF